MQCHRSRIDALRASLAGLPTGSVPYAGKDVEQLTDDHALRIVSRMQRRAYARSEGYMSLPALIKVSHRRSRQRASGTRR